MTRLPGTDYIAREAGILLHPTSLPSPHGIGDLGPEARAFVDFLNAAGQGLWQLLPLGPTGPGNSPYAARSAVAGNPLLLSLDLLVEERFLWPNELENRPDFPAEQVDYQAAAAFKMPLLRRAWIRFQEQANPTQRSEFDAFCRRNAPWMDDYALFAALSEVHDGAPWFRWGQAIARRDPREMERRRAALASDIRFHQFVQFQFSRQWAALRRYANQQGIRIVGDLPIFVALDSVDVWARPDLFYLDDRGRPTVVAGVPPDYFSRTGQRWGNPLYRWDEMAVQGYSWWIERFRVALRQVDLIRIDHFRGFEAYYEIPASHRTAERGRWAEGPGENLFHAVEAALGKLPLIAEDLGTITPRVEALRLKLGYPGMKVLQFAFDSDARNPHLPHNFERRSVVYTGTHDNDTARGWFQSRTDKNRAYPLRYLASDGREIHWDLIRVAYASIAQVAVTPLQDVLGLGAEARMNRPGNAEGNWRWRYPADQLRSQHGLRLKEMVETYGRSFSLLKQLSPTD